MDITGSFHGSFCVDASRKSTQLPRKSQRIFENSCSTWRSHPAGVSLQRWRCFLSQNTSCVMVSAAVNRHDLETMSWLDVVPLWHGMVGHFPWTGSSPFDMEGLRKVTQDILHILPSGKRTCLYYKPCSYWTWQFIVDLSIKNGHFPQFSVCLPEGTLLWRNSFYILVQFLGQNLPFHISWEDRSGSAPSPSGLRAESIWGKDSSPRHMAGSPGTIHKLAQKNSRFGTSKHCDMCRNPIMWGWVKTYYHYICGNNNPVSIYFRVPRVPGFWPRTMLEISMWIYHDK